MSEITALPGLPIPGTEFHRDQPVVYRGDRKLFLAVDHTARGPVAILWHGFGFDRISHIEEIQAEDTRWARR